MRQQLETLLKSNQFLKETLDPSATCAPEREPFLRCVLAGLFLNTARRSTTAFVNAVAGTCSVNGTSKFSFSQNPVNARLISAVNPSRALITGDSLAPFQTLRGRQMVHVHPSSVLFSSRFTYRYEQEQDEETSDRTQNVSIRNSTSGGQRGSSAKKDRLPQLVAFAELLVNSKQYMRTMTVLQESWLQEELTQDQLNLLR